MRRVEAGGGGEVRQLEVTARILDPAPQHVQRAAPFDFAHQAALELFHRLRAVLFFQVAPGFGLDGGDEGEGQFPIQAQGAVVVFGAAPLQVAVRGDQMVDDVGLKGMFGDVHRVTSTDFQGGFGRLPIAADFRECSDEYFVSRFRCG